MLPWGARQTIQRSGPIVWAAGPSLQADRGFLTAGESRSFSERPGGKRKNMIRVPVFKDTLGQNSKHCSDLQYDYGTAADSMTSVARGDL